MLLYVVGVCMLRIAVFQTLRLLPARHPDEGVPAIKYSRRLDRTAATHDHVVGMNYLPMTVDLVMDEIDLLSSPPSLKAHTTKLSLVPNLSIVIVGLTIVTGQVHVHYTCYHCVGSSFPPSV